MMWISRYLLRIFRAKLPAMSVTEQEAIAAGDTWWEKELFCGRPDWQVLHDYPKPKLASNEKAFLENQVTKLCAMLDDWDITQNRHDMSPEAWEYIKHEKFLGLVVPEEYGGLGFSAYAHSCVITMLASRSYSAAVSVMVPNSLGPAELVQHYGTDSQKNYYLPRLAGGQEVPCFALTSPTAGSDATSITDTGMICKQQDIIGLRLNWNKRYITLAPVATLIGLAVHVYDPDQLLGAQHDIGITMVLVSSDTPGVESGRRHMPLHQAFLNGPTSGKDVFIPLDNVIGGAAMLGKGWQIMTTCLAVGRGISLPAVSTAAAKLCYRMTGAYARVREQFNVPIGKFEGVAVVLARIGAGAYVADAARCFTTAAIDGGVKPAVASAITKYHLTELSRTVINDAMDVHGGRGIMMGEDNYLANLYIAIPIGITVEGANILTRNLIIFGQGAFRCHPYLAQELEAANQNDIKRFNKLIFKHTGYLISNFGRSFCYGVTAGKWIRAPKRDFARYYRQLTRMSCALALVTDVAFILLGGALKRRENLSSRLGDVLSQLYLASSVLKYYSDQGNAKADQPFVQYALEKCLFDAQTAMLLFLENLPNRLMRWLLKHTIFFWGQSYRMPQDKIAMQIAEASMQSSEQRDRLTKYCYIGTDDKKNTGLMESAFQAAIADSQAFQKLQNAAIQVAAFENMTRE